MDSASPRGSLRTNNLGVEPFSTRFLTPEDLRNISEFQNNTSDKSISSILLSPVASFLAKFIPSTLAPNVLTLTSLVCILHAYTTTYQYKQEHYAFALGISVLMFTCYHILDLVDGKHAKNIKNDTPLGYFFNMASDAVGLSFVVVTVGWLVGLSEGSQLWYLVQLGHLVFLWAQVSAFDRGYLSWGLFTGPGEAVFMLNSLLLMRGLFGGGFLYRLWSLLVNVVGRTLGGLELQQALLQNPSVAIETVYYMLLVGVVLRTLLLRTSKNKTRNYLLFVLLYRSIPALLFGSGIARSVSLMEIVADGLFMSIVTTDLVVARMAQRELHDWILVMSMFSLLDKFLTLFLCIFYYASIFYDICTFMNLPLLTPVINVYIDGVFDLCHCGHKNHVFRALKYGNRLMVGVMADEDVLKYKRAPVMTLAERVAEVESLRCVYKVIPGAPCFGLTKEFLDEWKIHVVLCSPEYDKPNDNYYAVPRALGTLKVMPRTEGMSTSDLIKRILDRYAPATATAAPAAAAQAVANLCDECESPIRTNPNANANANTTHQ